MRNFLTSVFIVFITVPGIGCSSGASNNANSDTVVTSASPEATAVQPHVDESNFADANQALTAGIKLLEEGETDRAIAALSKAVEMDPQLADAYFHLGIAYALAEKRDADIVTAETEATPVPRGKKPAEKKQNSVIAFEKAVAAYKKIVTADKDNAAAHYNIGRAYNKLDEDEDAAKSLKTAVKLNPEDSEYQTELGAILVKLAQYREAIPALEKALELDPANSRAEELLSDALAGRRRIDYTQPKNANKNVDRTVKPPRSRDGNTSPAQSETKTPSNTSVKPAFPPNRPN